MSASKGVTVVGAGVAGLTAAKAVRDRGAAYEEFLRLTRFYRWSFRMKRLHDRAPLGMRRLFWSGLGWAIDKAGPEAQRRGFRFVPGYGDF